MEISEAKKLAGRYCCAYGCSNAPVKKKGGLCHKHYKRKIRAEDPIQIRYNDFKAGAKKRDIYFDITLEEFRGFCQRTGYLIVKGRRGKNATIDRIENWRGYTIDNIQLLTNYQNIRKYYDHDRHQDEHFIDWDNNEDLPF